MDLLEQIAQPLFAHVVVIRAAKLARRAEHLVGGSAARTRQLTFVREALGLRLDKLRKELERLLIRDGCLLLQETLDRDLLLLRAGLT